MEDREYQMIELQNPIDAQRVEALLRQRAADSIKSCRKASIQGKPYIWVELAMISGFLRDLNMKESLVQVNNCLRKLFGT